MSEIDEESLRGRITVLLDGRIWMFPVIMTLLLLISAQYSYLGFHTFAELFAIVISYVMFTLAWFTFDESRNKFLLFLACGYFWIGSLDLIHTLVYPGMDVLLPGNSNLTVEFWIGARYAEALLMLAAPFAVTRNLNKYVLVTAFGAIAIGIVLYVFSGYFPQVFVEGEGLTTFKVASEYIIVFILLLALVSILRTKNILSVKEEIYVVTSILLTVGAELCFTIYIDPYGLSNFFGHIFKFFSYWFILQAIVVSNLRKPYTALQQSELGFKVLFDSIQIATWSVDFSRVVKALNELRADGVTRLDQYFRENPRAIKQMAASLKITYVNPATLNLYQARSKQEFIDSLDKVLGRRSMIDFNRVFNAIWEKEKSFTEDTTQRTLGGDLIDVIISMPIPDTEEAFSRIPLSILDITRRKASANELLASEHQYRTLVESAPMCIHQIDQDGNLLSMNRSGLKILGVSDENEIKGLAYLSVVAENDRDRVAGLMDDAFRGNFSEFEFAGTDNTEFSSNFVPLADADGEITRLLGITQDISERKHTQAQLSYQTSHDGLTGLLNRYEFEMRINKVLDVTKIHPDEHAICFIDLDQFKVINDSCGHVAGDMLLKQLGKVLLGNIRTSDTLARLGGDEFGVLIESCSFDRAHRVAENILAEIQGFNFIWDKKTYHIGASIGLVAITESTTSFTELFRQADAACYLAKDQGRNRIHAYRPDDAELALLQGQMQWVGRINQALDDNRFCLYAQPIVPLAGNSTLLHYELLLRMKDEEGQIVPPDAFLPAAERYNLIEVVDRWVVSCACRFLSEHPLFVERVEFVSINLSGPSMTNTDFLGFVMKNLRKPGIVPEKICFEVTETVAVSNLEAAASFITILKQVGCRFALDDFGSGLSSFEYLKNLPVDYLKIDGMFVKNIVDDPIDLAMVKSINNIGQVMGMQTIAEYVENDEIKGILKAIGVDHAQGYGLGKPVPLDDLSDELDRQIDGDEEGKIKRSNRQ